jgi:endonuclease YncB( thermonuclease family)
MGGCLKNSLKLMGGLILVVIGLGAIGAIFSGGSRSAITTATVAPARVVATATPAAAFVAQAPMSTATPDATVAVHATRLAAGTPVGTSTGTSAPVSAPGRDTATVVEVVRSDTLRVRYGHGETAVVRLLGVETPGQTLCYGQEAQQRTIDLVAGRLVQLEREAGSADGLSGTRAVWVTDVAGATRFVNEELVKWGYARAVTPAGAYAGLLQSAQREAERERRGTWGACASFAAALPTPVPATATPAVTAAEQAYATEIAGQSQLMQTSLSEVTRLSRSPQLFNETWRLQYAIQLAAWKVAHESARKLSPPPRFRAFHDRWVAALAEFDRAADDIAFALDNPFAASAVPRMNAGAARMNRANMLVNEAQAAFPTGRGP